MSTRLATAEDAARWLSAHVQGRLVCDSRVLQPGDGFVAWPGAASDGRRFVADALAAGAAACLVEEDGVEAFALPAGRVATLRGLKAASGQVADLFHARPSAALDVLAVTGTNGKTSCSWWTAQALTRLGRRSGVIGTLGVGEPPHGMVPTGLTTPDPFTLHGALRGFVDAGFSACAMEASSIGIAEERLAGVRIAVALFTNFTRDHLDYHGSMADYWAAKRRLFNWPGLRAAVLNIDDAQGAALADELQAGSGPALWTVSLHGPARLQAQGLQHTPQGLCFTVHEGADHAELRTALVGEFNAANLLLVLAGLRALGVPLAEAAAACATVSPVPGRLQRVGEGAPEVLVDYAHTPDALEKLLQALRPLASARGGRLWCVFGCGGNRDATKRPLMGAIAARGADHVVLTSDNPRDENPSAILAQILAGVTGHDEIDVIEDRREAIRSALREAAATDVVVIAGKGHENYQEVAGVRRPFSDLAEAQAALAQRSAVGATGVAPC